MTNQFDIIVVGAGPGGASVAALLAKKGKRVLLVDKNNKAGGRMTTVQRGGFSFEMFPINCVPTNNSNFEKLLKAIDAEDEVDLIVPESDKTGVLIYEDDKGVMRSWNTMWWASRLRTARTSGVGSRSSSEWRLRASLCEGLGRSSEVLQALHSIDRFCRSQERGCRLR